MGSFSQAPALQPLAVRIVADIFGGAEDRLIKILLGRTIALGGFRRQQFNNQVGIAAALLPYKPVATLRQPIDATDIKEIRAAIFSLASLLLAVVNKHV